MVSTPVRGARAARHRPIVPIQLSGHQLRSGEPARCPRRSSSAASRSRASCASPSIRSSTPKRCSTIGQRCGARVLNGADVLAIDSSKARQLSLIAVARLRQSRKPGSCTARRTCSRPPRAWTFRCWSRPTSAARAPGSSAIVGARSCAPSIDERTVPAVASTRSCWSRIMCRRAAARSLRIETLGGKFLYAIEVESGGDSFDLCPADACVAAAGPHGHPDDRGRRPPPELIDAAERIARAAGLDVGGIEVMIDDRDGTPRFYDINAMSNFVADPLNVLGWDPHDRLVDYLEARRSRRGSGMRFGYWMPVFGGWLRNIPDEGMEASWDYVKRLTQRSEEIGWDLTLIAELNLNDIKGVDQPALDAWSTAAALAAVTAAIELMVAVRPNFHQPALFAKEAANIDNISDGRLALNVVSSWWADEAHAIRPAVRPARRPLCAHRPNGCRSSTACGPRTASASTGERYQLDDAICEPKPVRKPRPTIYAGGESEAAKTMIATPVRRLCDARRSGRGDRAQDRRHGGAPRRAPARAPMQYGMAAFAIVRDSEAEAKRELERITADAAQAAQGLRQFRPVAVGHRSSSAS